MWRKIILSALGGILLFAQGILNNFWPAGLLTIIGFAGIPGNVGRWWSAAMWLGTQVVAWLPAILGFTLIGFANWGALTQTAPAEWAKKKFGRSIPLPDATWRAYQRFATTAYGRMAENGKPGDEDGIRRWFAWHIWQRVPIHGARYPSQEIRRIPGELKTQSDFEGSANALRVRGENTVFRNLRVMRPDFDSYINQIDELLADNPRLNI